VRLLERLALELLRLDVDHADAHAKKRIRKLVGIVVVGMLPAMRSRAN